jgi:starch synthase
MNVLFVTSEAVPLAKTGGLADVAGALPKALKQEGVNAAIMLPKYNAINDKWLTQFTFVKDFKVQFGWREQFCGIWQGEIEGIRYYLIENEFYFFRGQLYGYGDDAERFVFYNVAVMEAINQLGLQFDIIHCNDWQTGLIPLLIKKRYDQHPKISNIKSVFTIHNLMYQGVFNLDLMRELLGMPNWDDIYLSIEFFGDANMMKAGLTYADKITTVSPTYAQEIQSDYYGEKLNGLLTHRAADLVGIINGIDEQVYDPMADQHIEHPYRHAVSRKQKNKLALQKELALPVDATIPMLGVVSRLVEQKGFDLFTPILDELLQHNVQLVVVGSGDEKFERFFYEATLKYPTKVSFWRGYSDRMASRIYAASDIFLMPSRFEPCGLSQLIALQYRSVAVVRETGGLKDTIKAYNEFTFEGNGFSFATYNAHEFLFAIKRALNAYAEPSVWKRIIENGARQSFSWKHSARQYKNLYRSIG